MYRSVGQQAILVDDPSSSSSKYCPNRPGVCATAAALKDAKAKCRTTQVRGLGISPTDPVCTSHDRIGAANGQYYNPCWVKTLPQCPTIPALPPAVTAPPQVFVPETDGPVTTMDEPPGDGEGDDNNSYMVGGILAVLVIGGIGYAVFKNRKKKGRR